MSASEMGLPVNQVFQWDLTEMGVGRVWIGNGNGNWYMEVGGNVNQKLIICSRRHLGCVIVWPVDRALHYAVNCAIQNIVLRV